MSYLSNRRDALINKMKENSVLLVFSGTPKIASADEEYPFVCNKNFYYLTNIKQEHSILMIIKGVGMNKVFLFVDEYSPLKEKWFGHKITFEDAKENSEINNVYPMSSFDDMFSYSVKERNNPYGKIDTLYLDLFPELKIDPSFSTLEFKKKIEKEHAHLNIIDLSPILLELRFSKDEQEISYIKEAINITNMGISHLLLHLHSGMKEHELADEFEFFGRSHGRHSLAFSPIVASGKNGVILHHPIEQQNDTIEKGSLVLFDIGFSNHGYSADVSRTYPVDGRFTDEQRKIYEAVLNCNKEAIKLCVVGNTPKQLQEFAVEFLRKECMRLGLMNESDDIKNYYYHSISHHLGLDTHDDRAYETPYVPGCVITIEPGLYFKDKGIGVRIEDDVKITNEGPVVLTAEIKKEIADIEKMLTLKR